MDCGKVAGILLAAGRGTRFGGNKLEAMLGDAMLGVHAARTLAGMGCGHLFAVHDPAHAALAKAFGALGFTFIDNDDPAAGLSHSLSLAAKAALTTDADGLLVCLADMPFVTTDHLRILIDASSDRIIASAIGDTRTPPALFPRALWPTLAALTGETGARAFLRDAIAIQGSTEMLADIDTPADLNHWS
jgi:molybdenum cofactor cytidylyltransferase